MKSIDRVSYQIDKRDVIVGIYDNWITAAKVGKASNLIDTTNILGTELLSYITGNSTKVYYDIVFQKCRFFNVNHIVEYRCDSPTHMRFMEMQIIPEANGLLTIHNYLLKQVPFKNSLNILDISEGGRKTEIKRCSICNKLKLDYNDVWINPEVLVHFEEKFYSVIHTVCNNCSKKDIISKYG